MQQTQPAATFWTQRLPTPRDEHRFFCLRTRAGLLLQRLSLLKDAKESKDPRFTRLEVLLGHTLDELLDDTKVSDVIGRWQNALREAEDFFSSRVAPQIESQSPFYQQWSAWTTEQGRLFAREQWSALDSQERARLDMLLSTLSFSPFPALEVYRRSRQEISFRVESEWAFAWIEGFFLELQSRCQFNDWDSTGVMRVTIA